MINFMDYILHRRLDVTLKGASTDKGESTIQTHDALVFTYKGVLYRIPAGFCCDGCSVPEAFQTKIKKINPRYLFAYIVHDFFYTTRQVKREQADEILLWMLRQLDAPKLRRFNVYMGVRLFGWTHWR